MDVLLQVDSRDGASAAKFGVQGGDDITATKVNALVWGGHSAQGMIYAKELANRGTTASITTISRRGRPGAPGLSSAFLSAMASESVHYLAACDIGDTKAVECLLDWAPPVEPSPWDLEWQGGPSLEGDRAWIDQRLWDLKGQVAEAGPTQLRSLAKSLEELKWHIVHELRETKKLLQRKSDQANKSVLETQQSELQEYETIAMELLADVAAKSNAQEAPSALSS